jgi:hypothetical protein
MNVNFFLTIRIKGELVSAGCASKTPHPYVFFLEDLRKALKGSKLSSMGSLVLVSFSPIFGFKPPLVKKSLSHLFFFSHTKKAPTIWEPI